MSEWPTPIEWKRLSTAPRDGTWLLLEVEDGTTDCDDRSISSVYVGRWNPKNFPDLGEHFYEWEVIQRYPDSAFQSGEITTHYVEGRVNGWLPLPVLM